MFFSIVIVSLNGERALPGCLRALGRARESAADADDEAAARDFEVVVVDNGSNDATARVARLCWPEARIVRSDINLGFAGGANLGLRVATGSALVLLNDDTEVQPGWLEALADAARRHPDWGALGCRLLYPGGVIQSAGARIAANALTSHVGCEEPDEPSRYGEIAEQPYVCGAAIALRREAVEAVNYLDAEYYPIYFEEVDFCVRARRLGYRCLYVPDARVIHLESRTTVARSHGYYVKYHRNRLRFVARNYSPREWARFARAEARWLAKDCPRQVYWPLTQAYLQAAARLPATLLSRWRAAPRLKR